MSVAAIFAANQDAPNPLTFGVEIEILVPYLKINEGEYLISEEAATKYIASGTVGKSKEPISLLFTLANKMEQAGFQTTVAANSSTEPIFWVVTNDDSMEARTEQTWARASGTFQFEPDKATKCLRSLPEVKGGARSLITFGLIEIKTPRLRFTQSGMEALDRFLGFMDKEIPAAVNDSCGLHVHVGHRFSDRPAYRLGDLKNVFLTAVLGEYQLAQLHPKQRFFENSYSRLNSSVFPPRFRRNAHFIVRQVEACKTKSALARLATNPWAVSGVLQRFFHVNLFPLSSEGWTNRTIEFRTHEGTVLAEEISTWAKFCGSFVFACTEAQMPSGPTFLLGAGLDMRPNQFLSHLRLHDFVNRFPLYIHSVERYTSVRDKPTHSFYTRLQARMTVNRPEDISDSSDTEEPPYQRPKREMVALAQSMFPPYNSDDEAEL